MRHKFHVPLLLSFSLALSLAGCSSPNQGSTTEVGVRSAATEVPKLRVVEATCDGSLCPPGSVTNGGMEEGFKLQFSAAVISGEGGTPVTGSADVTVDFEVPPGFQFSPGHYDSVVSASKSPETRLVFERRYAFVGSSDTRRFADELDATEFVRDIPELFWSPSCGQDQGLVRLQVRLGATVEGEDFFALDSFTGGFARLDGILWRRCGETEPIPLPPSGKNGDCGDASRLVCAPALACELSENPVPGICVDPTEVVEPQPRDTPCGGLRAIPCQEGLVCHYRNASSPGEGKTGSCKPALGREGDTCGPHPDIPCAAGLTCFDDGNRRVCVNATGEFKSPCGDGLPECKEGLQCNTNVCRYPSAQEGEPCGGPREIICSRDPRKPRLKCEDGVCRRVTPPDAGF